MGLRVAAFGRLCSAIRSLDDLDIYKLMTLFRPVAIILYGEVFFWAVGTNPARARRGVWGYPPPGNFLNLKHYLNMFF